MPSEDYFGIIRVYIFQFFLLFVSSSLIDLGVVVLNDGIHGEEDVGCCWRAKGRIDNSSSLCVSSESQRQSSIAVTKLEQPASRTDISFSRRVFSTDFAKDLPFGRDVKADVTKQMGHVWSGGVLPLWEALSPSHGLEIWIKEWRNIEYELCTWYLLFSN